MDGFGSPFDKMPANSVVRNEILKKKDFDPFLKLEGQNIVLESNSVEKSSGNLSVTMGIKESRFITPSSGFESFSKSGCSVSGTGIVVEELTLEHHRKLLSDTVANGFRSKQFHGNFMPQDRDKTLLRVRGELIEMSTGIRSLKPVLSNHSEQNLDKLPPYLMVEDNKFISSNMLSIAKNQLKDQSTTSHSQLPLKESLKEKRLAKLQEPCSGLDNLVMEQNDKNLGYGSEVASDTRLRSNVNNHQLSSHVLRKFGPKSSSNGISLREWLRPGDRKVNMVERLLIFRQIVELVDFAHCQGVAMQDLRPSCFIILTSNKIKYTGSSTVKDSVSSVQRDSIGKRPLEQDACTDRTFGGKQKKMSEGNEDNFGIAGTQDSGHGELQSQMNSTFQNTLVAVPQQSISAIGQLEVKWYTSPDELNERDCALSSNVYGLGVLLFELLCRCESWKVHLRVMLDLHHRILPPEFLSKNPLEAGFCFWLLHPDPFSRPTTREILQSKLMRECQEQASSDDLSKSAHNLEAETDILLSFLNPLKDKKVEHASKLVEDIRCLEEEISKFGRRHLSRVSSDFSPAHKELREREEGFCLEDPVSSVVSSRLFPASGSINKASLMKNISQLADAYALARSPIETAPLARSSNNVLNDRDRWCHVQNGTQGSNIKGKSDDRLGAFFDGFCKFSRHSKFEVCGTIRNGDLVNSSNVICSLSFDRDEDYIATAGVSKKIKIFDFGALVDNSLDIHYPVVVIPNKSKLSCVCWNNYFKNYLASADYDGVVQMWDAATGQGVSQYVEHQKRAWSVDFSQAVPKTFASGSDDFSVKLWSLNEKNSTGTIWNPANVCCVQFSDYSSNLLVFGSADYKIYGYDLRHTRIPWCTLPGHGRAVSYVKFVDSETLVSASTDNTLKLWNLNQSISTGLSINSCSLTFSGHTNQKNFVGLSVSDGYIACGSETNEVYSYYRSLPMPIMSHKFGSIDPVSGSEVTDYSGQFVSSVCWRRKSKIVVAANSTGTLKLLQMV